MTAETRPLSIEIAYCAGCHFLPRASWIAQELLHTYAEYTFALTLIPAHGGILEIRVNGDLLFSTKDEDRFPEIRELKDKINRYLAADATATFKQHPAGR